MLMGAHYQYSGPLLRAWFESTEGGASSVPHGICQFLRQRHRKTEIPRTRGYDLRYYRYITLCSGLPCARRGAMPRKKGKSAISTKEGLHEKGNIKPKPMSGDKPEYQTKVGSRLVGFF